MQQEALPALSSGKFLWSVKVPIQCNFEQSRNNGIYFKYLERNVLVAQLQTLDLRGQGEKFEA